MFVDVALIRCVTVSSRSPVVIARNGKCRPGCSLDAPTTPGWMSNVSGCHTAIVLDEFTAIVYHIIIL